MDRLNDGTAAERLNYAKEAAKESFPEADRSSVNNHIHTFYSFSPYSPTKAVYMAKKAGLSTAGIVDHDSVSGVFEFIEAGRIFDIKTTVGCECRVSMKNTPFKDKRINSPDQKGIAYVAMHGIPHRNITQVDDFFVPLREKRNERNRLMTKNLNRITGLNLDFDKDVLPVSKFDEGGSVTERHLLYALSLKIMNEVPDVIGFLNSLGISVSEKVSLLLTDKQNPIAAYDLLGVLKGHLVEKFYIDASDECPDVTEFIALCKKVGAISAYAYLGDVTNSVTGDKKAQTFEDEYIEDLFKSISSLGFNAVTYMPSRNTHFQLMRVKALCAMHGLMEISGEDINSPRQSFVCEEIKKPEFQNLIDSTYFLIKHENI